jgi:hypothetical protein
MTAEKAPREDMMDDIDRRGALGLFGLAIGADGILGSAVAQEVAQAETKTATPPAIASAANIEPASNVNGDYQAVYHEGYAQAFLALGFSEEFLLQMFSEVTDSMTITATTKALFLRAKAGRAERQITLGSPGPVEVFGTKIPDRYARFDQPNRLVISFTAPNGKRVEAVQTFYADGYVTVLSIDGAPHLKPVRIWKRVVNNEQAKRKLPQLFPL